MRGTAGLPRSASCKTRRLPKGRGLRSQRSWRSDEPKPNLNPVRKKNLENLQHVLVWRYGSKSDSIKPVIVSQNPDLKMLGPVLSNPGARTVLMMRNNLREAYQQVESKSARFETASVNARQEAETAMSQIIGYDPDDTTLLEIGANCATTPINSTTRWSPTCSHGRRATT